MEGKRKNYNLEETTIKRLEKIAQFYGMNQTATISMLITDKYVQVTKDENEILKETNN